MKKKDELKLDLPDIKMNYKAREVKQGGAEPIKRTESRMQKPSYEDYGAGVD